MEKTQKKPDRLYELNDIVKIYESRSVKTPALRGVNFEVNKGESILITGPSGSGKSTLLNILGLLDVPTTGKFLISNEDAQKWNKKYINRYKREFIGFVFQNSNLFPNLTVWQNLWIELYDLGLDAEEKKERIEMYLKMIGLSQKRHNYPDELSGGQKQRVAVIAAVIKHPSVIIADEPTAELDMQNKEKTIELLFKLQNLNPSLTIIVASHDDIFKEKMQRVINIVDGLIIKDGSPQISQNKKLVTQNNEIFEFRKVLSCPNCGNHGIKKFQNDQNIRIIDSKAIGLGTLYCDKCGFNESKEYILYIIK